MICGRRFPLQLGFMLVCFFCVFFCWTENYLFVLTALTFLGIDFSHLFQYKENKELLIGQEVPQMLLKCDDFQWNIINSLIATSLLKTPNTSITIYKLGLRPGWDPKAIRKWKINAQKRTWWFSRSIFDVSGYKQGVWHITLHQCFTKGNSKNLPLDLQGWDIGSLNNLKPNPIAYCKGVDVCYRCGMWNINFIKFHPTKTTRSDDHGD